MKITPYDIVILGILLTPAFFFAFIWGHTEIAIVLYLAAFASDIANNMLSDAPF